MRFLLPDIFAAKANPTATVAGQMRVEVLVGGQPLGGDVARLRQAAVQTADAVALALDINIALGVFGAFRAGVEDAEIQSGEDVGFGKIRPGVAAGR
jgi:hypothetical protein